MQNGLTIEFNTTSRILMREGALKDLPSAAAHAGARHILFLTDPGLVKIGLVEPILVNLRAAGFQVTLDDRAEVDPPVRVVLRSANEARDSGVDLVVGFGGGSAMDTAKLVAYLVRNPCDLETIYGVDLAQGMRLPLILIPTTAGTGSEVTPIAIVTTDNDEKRGIVSSRLLPDLALLDSETTLQLPPATTAATGIDAMVHAIEAYTSRIKKNPISDALARQALTLLATNLPIVMATPGDRPARSAMLLGSCLAGMSFANAPVGAVHALAYPLGGRYHVPHGLSNALMLLPVLKFNLTAAAVHYGELAVAVGARSADADSFLERIGELLECTGLPCRLREVGVTANSLDSLAEDAMRQTRLLVNNPVALTRSDALRLYEEVF
jgi:alcohol dehydrogenase class IV